MPTLKVTSGPAAGRTLTIAGELLIGREHADLTLADPEVSRRHAMLRPVGDAVAVEDLGSTNGTLVNGEKIEGVVVVSETGTLQVGKSELTIDIPVPEPVPEPEPPPVDAAATSLRNVPPPIDDRTAARAVPQEPAPAPAEAPASAPVDDRTSVRPVAQPAQQPQAPDPAIPAAAPTAPPSPPQAPPAGPPRIAASAPPIQPSAAGAKAPPRRSPLPIVVGVLILLLVAAGVAIAAGSGTSKKNRTLTANLTTVPLTTQGFHAVQSGLVAGAPGSSETGSVTFDEHFRGNPNTKKNPVPLTANVTMRYSGGTLKITANAKLTPKKNGGVIVIGTGRVTGGSGKFKGATGSITLNGGRASATSTNATFVVRGRVKS